jgi:uncharacterized protein (DUF58 family)
MSKLEYGMFLTAALGYLMLHQKDAVGLAMFDHGIRQFLPPRATSSHFQNLLAVMEQATPGEDTRLGPVLSEVVGRIPKRGIVIVISDLLDDVQAITDGLAHCKHRRHEVIVLHVMDPAERTFPFEKLTRFKDLEGAGSLVANPRSVKQAYLQRLNDYLDRVRRVCLERDIAYELMSTDKRYDQALSAYLMRRSRQRR